MANTKVFSRKNDRAITETWAPILKEYGIDESRRDLQGWLAEYAHNHASFDNTGMPMYESVTPGLFYQQPGSISFMGAPHAPTTVQTPAITLGGKFGSSDYSGSGDKFPSLLPIAIQVAAKTIAFDLVSIIPMDAPVGFIPYLDYVYMGGRIDSKFPAFLIKLAMMNASGNPSMDSGTSTSSRRSRIPDMRSKTNIKPKPAKSAWTMEKRKLPATALPPTKKSSVFKTVTPRTTQLVVMSGR